MLNENNEENCNDESCNQNANPKDVRNEGETLCNGQNQNYKHHKHHNHKNHHRDEDCGRVQSKEDCSIGCDCDVPDECDDEVAQTANKYLDMAKRIQADFDNYRKRNQEAVANAREEGKASVISSILPCADAIERAIEMTKDENVLQGLKMVADKFTEVLSKLGVTKMECLGEQFDPNLHNVLSSIEVQGKESGEIVNVYACGYYMNGKVLRFAQVVVAK